MLSNQIIQDSISELKNITGIDIRVADRDGKTVVSTCDDESISAQIVRSFVASPADSQTLADRHLFRVNADEDTMYVVITKGSSEECYTVGRIATGQLRTLMTACEDRYDKNSFFQNLLLDNMLLVDIHNRAQKLHIPNERRRCVFFLELGGENDGSCMEMLKGLFSATQGDVVTSVDERSVILIKALSDEDGYPELEQIARTIVDMMYTEVMASVCLAYGTIVNELKEVSRSYKEARMALDVGRIFYREKRIVAYNTLGIGRLIYQLPTSLCEVFMTEVFGDNIPDDLDEETLTTINKFFENNLNVSETSRQLYLHRNTLVYRIEKLQKTTGLDIRVFDDALTLKIALMVIGYLKYLKGKE